MAYSDKLSARVAQIFLRKAIAFEVKKMMGGLCFMVDDKMCVGNNDDLLMARIAPDIFEHALTRLGCQPMDFTGRSMRGFVFVDPREA